MRKPTCSLRWSPIRPGMVALRVRMIEDHHKLRMQRPTNLLDGKPDTTTEEECLATGARENPSLAKFSRTRSSVPCEDLGKRTKRPASGRALV